ncbi:MAG: hypothetical protein AAFR61_31000 [Bacteroidota bacterium]
MKTLIRLAMLIFIAPSWTFSQVDITPKDLHFPGSFGQKKFRKAPRKVYLNHFQVHFQLAAYEATHDQQFLGAQSKAEIGVGLSGLQAHHLQETTDQLYQDFVQQLAAAEFDLISAEEAGQAELFSNWTLRQGGELREERVYGFALATPSDFAYYVKKASDKGDKKGSRLGELPRLARLSKQLDDAIVIDVSLVVNFVEFQGGKSKLISRAKLKATPQLHISPIGTGVGMWKNFRPLESRIYFVSGNPAGWSPECVLKVAPKKALYTPNALTGEIMEVAATGMPGWTMTRSATWTLPVDSTAYQQHSKDLLKAFTQATLNLFIPYTQK